MSDMMRVLDCSVTDVQLANIPLGMLADSLGSRFTFAVLAVYFGVLVAASLALPAPFIAFAGLAAMIALIPVELWMERAHGVALEQTACAYGGDSAFVARMEGMGVADPVAGELVAANREVRANAGAIAMSTVAVRRRSLAHQRMERGRFWPAGRM